MKIILLSTILILFSIKINAQETSFFRAKDGESLYYTTYGTGPVIIMLNGGPGYGCQNIFPWADFLKSNKCIFFDQRGCGLSKNVKINAVTINVKTFVNDIEELREHLKEKKLTIIGFSWGAGLAMSYAAAFPERVDNLILVSPIGPDLGYSKEMSYNIIARRSTQEKDSLNYWQKKEVITANPALSSQMQTYFTFIPYFYDHTKSHAVLWKLIKEADFNAQVFSLIWDDLKKTNYDIKPTLSKYTGKCSIIRGQQDVIGYKVINQIIQALPQTQVFEIEECGHFVDIEVPAAFNKYLQKSIK